MARSSLSKISYLCCAGSRALDMKLHGWYCPSSFSWYRTAPVATREASVSTQKGFVRAQVQIRKQWRSRVRDDGDNDDKARHERSAR